MEIVLLAWVLLLATMWLARILAEEMWAAIRGQTSPRIARRRAREQLARECGTPTIGQAVAFRVARRIADPPRRRWAADLRGLLDEVWADALEEARVRHQHAHEVRVRARQARQERAQRFGARPPRGQGWQAHTGGRPAPPAAEDDESVTATRPCRVCRRVFVVEPEELCTTCEQAAAPAAPPPDPDPDPPRPDDLDDDQITDEQEMPTMTSATHNINGDVRDPRTALSFATSCRGFNDGVVLELDILANHMEQAGVGPRPVAEIRVLQDAARAYSGSNSRSVKAYAQHVVTQADIAGDEDLAGTVRRTYLDTRGSDLAAPSSGRSARVSFSAADAHDPAAGVRFMTAVAAAYAALRGSVDQTKGNHLRQGVTDGDTVKPITFLNEQLELATIVAEKASQSARTFARHVQKMQDTIGKDKSLHRTQRGRYLDPAKA